MAVSYTHLSESTALAAKEVVPVLTGVPVIAPVDAFSANPAGSAPLLMENVYGLSLIHI